MFLHELIEALHNKVRRHHRCQAQVPCGSQVARASAFKVRLSQAPAFAPVTSHAAQPRQMATRADIATGARKKYVQLKARFTT